MSFAGLCAWTFLRSLSIALLSLTLIVPLSRFLAQQSQTSTRWLWALLLIPFLAPDLLTAYPYANSAWSLVHYPKTNELFYWLMLLMKFAPIGTLVLLLAPPSSYSAQAYHCHKLAAASQPTSIGKWLSLFVHFCRGPGRSQLFAVAIIFLLCFQEFELVSLIQFGAGGRVWPDSWTIRLFDAQAGGFSIVESLRLMQVPIAYQVLALILPFLLIISPQTNNQQSTASIPQCSPWQKVVAWAFLVFAPLVCFVLPGIYLIQQSLDERALAVLGQTRFFAREIITSTLFALFTAWAVVWLSHVFGPHSELYQKSRFFSQKWVRKSFLFWASAPGLLGSLMLSLLMLWASQTLAFTATVQQIFPYPVARVLSALPLLVTLSLWLLPRAFILQAMNRSTTQNSPLHVAKLIKASPHQEHQTNYQDLKWKLKTGPQFWFFVLIAYWSYWDLVAAALLIPPGLISAPQQINNLVHYGQWPVLSAMLAAAVGFPAILIIFALSIRRFLFRRL